MFLHVPIRRLPLGLESCTGEQLQAAMQAGQDADRMDRMDRMDLSGFHRMLPFKKMEKKIWEVDGYRVCGYILGGMLNWMCRVYLSN